MPQDKRINYRHKTFYTAISELWRNVERDEVKNIVGELIAKSALLVVFVYLVGTLLLLYRTHTADLPFSPPSIVQCATLTVYSAIVAGLFVATEHLVIDLIPLSLRRKDRNIVCKIIWCLAALCTIIFLNLLVISAFLNSLLEAIIILFLYYVFGIGVLRIGKGEDFFVLRAIWLALGCALFVVFLPANLGGFRVRQVSYCIYSNQTCQEYDYYGISEGLYQFVEDRDGERHVVLAPVDSGYIRYEQEKCKLFGLIEL